MSQQPIHTPRRTVSRQPAARRRSSFGLPLPAPGYFRWRIVSGILASVMVALLIFIFASPVFYVSQVEIGGVRYVPVEEIYRDSGIAGFHILWVDPDVVAENVEASPSIQFADVAVRWPARVIVMVREHEPAIVWQQDGNSYWVDVRGNLMVMRQDLPSLVRVVNEGGIIPFQCTGPECSEEDSVRISTDVILGTQHLKTLRENIDVLYYDPSRGLSYQDGRGWRGHFGVGTDMDVKLVVYEQIVDNLLARGLQPVYVDVSNPKAPFYKAN